MILLSFLRLISLEPAIFLAFLGFTIVYGVGIQLDLLMWKICHLELNYSEEICGNLTNEGFEDINNEVQMRSNNLLMIQQWLGAVPAIIYSFIAGSLLDKFGCKPFLIFPCFGLLICSICAMINYAFIEDLPVEFFFLDCLFNFFGGFPVYFLGYYSYGTLTTNPKNRSKTLARFDGFYNLGRLVAYAISPIVLLKLGRFGNYGIMAFCTFGAILHTMIFVPQPKNKCGSNNVENFVLMENWKMEKDGSLKIEMVKYSTATHSTEKWENNPKSKNTNVVTEFLLLPLYDLVKCLFKKRSQGLHWLIFIQLACYAMYTFSFEEISMRYLFMFKQFDGIEQVDYANFNIYSTIVSSVGLLVIFPTLSKYFGLHDATLSIICVGLEGIGLLSSAFCTELWQFYLSHSLVGIGYAKFALVRSLISKCVDPEETGKIYSAFAIIKAIVPLMANPIYRQLYNHTLSYFAGAEVVMSACTMFATILLNLYFHTQRHRLQNVEEEKVKKLNENIIGISHM